MLLLCESAFEKIGEFVMKFHQQVIFSLGVNITSRVLYINVCVVHNVAFV
jgi:hypothetical protein